MDLFLTMLWLVFLAILAFIVVIIGGYVTMIMALFIYYAIKDNIKSKCNYGGKQ